MPVGGGAVMNNHWCEGIAMIEDGCYLFILIWCIVGLVWFGNSKKTLMANNDHWKMLGCVLIAGPFLWIMGACAIFMKMSQQWFEKRFEQKEE